MLFVFIRSWSANGYLVYTSDLRRFLSEKLEIFEPTEPKYKIW
jgi:hypothetical protein